MATQINALFYHCHIKTVEGDREMELKIRAHLGFAAVDGMPCILGVPVLQMSQLLYKASDLFGIYS